MDTFSRKGMIYGHNSKQSNNILNDIIENCLNNGFPKEFLFYKGPVFKNAKTNEFCIINNINYIHWIPIILFLRGL